MGKGTGKYRVAYAVSQLVSQPVTQGGDSGHLFSDPGNPSGLNDVLIR